MTKPLLNLMAGSTWSIASSGLAKGTPESIELRSKLDENHQIYFSFYYSTGNLAFSIQDRLLWPKSPGHHTFVTP